MKRFFDTRVAKQLLKEQLSCDYMPEKGSDLFVNSSIIQFNSNFIDPNFLEFQTVCGGEGRYHLIISDIENLYFDVWKAGGFDYLARGYANGSSRMWMFEDCISEYFEKMDGMYKDKIGSFKFYKNCVEFLQDQDPLYENNIIDELPLVLQQSVDYAKGRWFYKKSYLDSLKLLMS